MFLLLGFAFLGGEAQVLNRALQKKYPGSVVLKVYEIASATSLTDAQQLRIAEHFTLYDQLKADAIFAGRNASAIDSIEKASQGGLVLILTKDQVAEVLNMKSEKFASAIATGEMRYLKDRHSPDSLLGRKLLNAQLNKYRSIYKQYFTVDGRVSLLPSRLHQVTGFYDSVIYSVLPVLYSQNYFNRHIEKIRQARQPDDAELIQMKKHFYAQLGKGEGQDWGQALLEATQYALPDTAVFSRLYKEKIGQRALSLTAAELYNLQNVHKLADSTVRLVHGLLRRKAYALSLSEYAYAAYPFKREESILSISRHYDSLIERSLLQNGALVAQSQFAIALRYKELLGLRRSLTDTLLHHALRVSHLRDSVLSADPFAKTDFKAYEAYHLNNLLSEEQYSRLLFIKNRSQAAKDAQDDWDEMVLRNLATSLQKETALGQLNEYYLAKWNAYYRLAHDKLRQESNLRLLKDHQPKILKQLSAAQKQPLPVNENTNLLLTGSN